MNKSTVCWSKAWKTSQNRCLALSQTWLVWIIENWSLIYVTPKWNVTFWSNKVHIHNRVCSVFTFHTDQLGTRLIECTLLVLFYLFIQHLLAVPAYYSLERLNQKHNNSMDVSSVTFYPLELESQLNFLGLNQTEGSKSKHPFPLNFKFRSWLDASNSPISWSCIKEIMINPVQSHYYTIQWNTNDGLSQPTETFDEINRMMSLYCAGSDRDHMGDTVVAMTTASLVAHS